MAVAISNWKALFFMQSSTSWQKFPVQAYRPEHHHEQIAPPHTPDNGSST